jgi:hypothetical protein
MRFALAFALALGLAAMSGAAQQSTILTNGRNLQIPINHGLPDKPLGFYARRLRAEHPQGEKVQVGRRLSASRLQLHGASLRADQNDDQPLEQRLPRLANVTAMDPDLFRCPFLRMQNAANYDFTPEETARATIC